MILAILQKTFPRIFKKKISEKEILMQKIQKCYTEIWKTQVYPLSMKGKPKADDILKREFPFLKPE